MNREERERHAARMRLENGRRRLRNILKTYNKHPPELRRQLREFWSNTAADLLTIKPKPKPPKGPRPMTTLDRIENRLILLNVPEPLRIWIIETLKQWKGNRPQDIEESAAEFMAQVMDKIPYPFTDTPPPAAEKPASSKHLSQNLGLFPNYPD